MSDDTPVTTAVLAAREGDQAAWDRLVDRFVPLVASVVRRHRLYGQDAEDVSQTVWLRLVEHLDAIREPRALPGWIVTTTRNECLRVITARRRSTPFDPSTREDLADPADPADPDEAMVRGERHEALLSALAQLPDHQRDLLLLMMADPPLSYAEIGRTLGIPVGSIGPTRARALDRVRSCPDVVALMDQDADRGEAGDRPRARVPEPARAGASRRAPGSSPARGGSDAVVAGRTRSSGA